MISDSPRSSTALPQNTYLKDWAFGISISILLIVAGGLRLYGANMPLSYDEVLQYRRAALPNLESILREIFYPVSTVLTHYSLYIGHSPMWIRLPNLIGGILAIYFVFLIMSQAGERLAGLFSAAVLTFLPYHIHHSQDARYYGLMSAFWTFHLLTILWVVRRYPFSLALYFFSILIALFNHPFFIFYAASALGAVAIYIILFKRQNRIESAKLLVLLGTLLISASILLYLSKMHFTSISTSSNEVEIKDRFILTAAEYIAILRRIGTPLGTYWEGLWYVLAGAGGILLLWRMPVIGLVSVFTVIVLPIPLLFISVSHWYDDRYFMPYAVNFALAVGLAITEVFKLPRQLIRSETLTWSSIVARLPFVISGTVLLIILFKSIPFKNLHQQKVSTRYSWQTLGSTLSEYIQSSDKVLHNLPTNNVGQARTVLNAYTVDRMEVLAAEQLRESSINNFIPEFVTSHQFGLDQPVDAVKHATNAPFSNIWLIEHKTRAITLPPELMSLFVPVTSTQEAKLRVLGEPTTNMVVGGGFDSDPSDDFASLVRHANAAVVPDPEDATPGQVLRLQIIDTTGTANAVLNLRSTEVFLRNRSFNLWKDGVPVGWELLGNKESIIEIPGTDEASALKISSGRGEKVLLQRIDGAMLPGSEIQISVTAKSGNRGLPLSLVYFDDKGSKSVVLDRTKPISTEWDNYEKRAVISSSAHIDSFKIELSTSQGSPVTVDKISIKITRPNRYFHSDRSYVLSCRIKGENIIPGAQRYWDQARIQLVGTTTDGKVINAELSNFYGTFSWRYLHIPIDPKFIRHLSAVSRAEVRVLLSKCTGTLWLDDLQLEQNNHPTPFVAVSRPPHDETLAELDLIESP